MIWSQSNSGAAADVLHRLAQQTAYLCKSIDIWSINKHRQVNLHSNYAARLDLIALPFLYANRYCVKHVVVGLGHHAVSEDDCGRLRRAVHLLVYGRDISASDKRGEFRSCEMRRITPDQLLTAMQSCLN